MLHICNHANEFELCEDCEHSILHKPYLEGDHIHYCTEEDDCIVYDRYMAQQMIVVQCIPEFIEEKEMKIQ
jgi:hypothetical protein